MQAVTLGLHNLDGTAAGMSGTPPVNQGNLNMDPAQLQQLLQLLGAAQANSMQPATFSMNSGAGTGIGPIPMTGLVSGPLGPQYTGQPSGSSNAPKQTAIVECPKNMVGRVIGKGGETIKALQQYTGAMIQIDQSTDPTRVTIAGSPKSLQLAVSMVNDIVRGTFKGFAMLRQIAISSNPTLNPFGQPQPVYVQGYGFVPPSQVFSGDEQQPGSQMYGRTSPRGPLTPPITPLRTAGTANLPGGSLPPETVAALLAGQPVSGQPSSSYPNQEALLTQLLERLSINQQAASSNQAAKQTAGLEQGAIQTMLAQAGIMSTIHPAGNTQPGVGSNVQQMQQMQQMQQYPMSTSAVQHFPPSSNVMLSAQGTPALLSHGEGPSAATAAASSYRMGSAPAAPLPSHRPGSVSPTSSTGVIGSTTGGLATSPSAAFTIGPPPGGQAGSLPGRISPPTNFAALSTASNPSLSPQLASLASGDGSPLGMYGAIGSGIAPHRERPSEAVGVTTFGSWDERRNSTENTFDGRQLQANGSRGGSGSDPVLKEHSEHSGSQQSGGLPPFPIDSPWDELLQ